MCVQAQLPSGASIPDAGKSAHPAAGVKQGAGVSGGLQAGAQRGALGGIQPQLHCLREEGKGGAKENLLRGRTGEGWLGGVACKLGSRWQNMYGEVPGAGQNFYPLAG